MKGGERKIEQFLTDRAVNKHVAPATQNQAMNALVFLYKRVLNIPLSEEINAVRAILPGRAQRLKGPGSGRRRPGVPMWGTTGNIPCSPNIPGRRFPG